VKRLAQILPAAAALAIPAAVQAADMRLITKAPPPPIFTWSGAYAGINIGYGIGHSPTTDTGVFTVPAAAIASQPFGEQFKHSPAGWLGGVQAGYNAQFSSGLLLGVEADMQWSGQKDTVCMFTCGHNTTGFFNLGGPGDTSQLADTQKLDWLATARLRIGYASNGFAGNAWLWYVTGGAAYGRVREDLVFTSSFIPGPPNPYPASGSASFAQNRLGWTAGAGVETRLSGNWSTKLEYLYVDLGGASNTFDIVSPLFGIPTLPRDFAISTASHLRDHIVRAGLNYQFDWGPVAPPAIVKTVYKAPPPAFVWNGTYAGINVGYGVGRSNTTDTGAFTVPAAAIASQPFGEQFQHSPVGWLAGVQAGYNAQFSSGVLLGVEADVQRTTQKDTVCMFACGNNTTGFFNLGGAGDSSQLTQTQKLDWLATARLRIGYASNAWLWYVTGGAAYGQVREDLVFTSSFIPGPPNPYPASGSATFVHGRLGWTAGTGVETRLSGNWSAKLEYLYVDLGGISDTLDIVSPLFGVPTLPRDFAITTTSHLHDHIVRAGLNYRFDWGPVAAKF
jgi:outer membrane immunogenic protein